mmetsp:Transcript_20960/g.31048  ORF Transcript_20960/g.31048 Transcript_20960/m.31048 type:complete len:175 (-) Transcript_20960:669-1193(-)
MFSVPGVVGQHAVARQALSGLLPPYGRSRPGTRPVSARPVARLFEILCDGYRRLGSSERTATLSTAAGTATSRTTRRTAAAVERFVRRSGFVGSSQKTECDQSHAVELATTGRSVAEHSLLAALGQSDAGPQTRLAGTASVVAGSGLAGADERRMVGAAGSAERRFGFSHELWE